MSVAAGLVERGRIYLGADSACNGGSVELLDRPKVRRRAGMLVAAAGDMGAVGVILDGMLLPKYEGGPINEWAVNILQPTIAECVGGGSRSDWTAMLAVPSCGGKLVTVDSAKNCVVHARRYAAIGSGEGFALGALCAVDWRRIAPRDKVLRAVLAAVEHDDAVRAPATVLSIPIS